MTQNGGIPAQVQGDEEGIGALPLIGWNVPLTRLSLPIYGGAHPTWDTRGSRTPPIAASPARPASDMLRRDPPHWACDKTDRPCQRESAARRMLHPWSEIVSP